MKMDKDTLVKQHFWIGLGVLGVLVLGVAFLQIAYGADDKEKKDFEGKLKSMKDKTSGFKNASFLPPWQEYGKKFTDQKDQIWMKAFVPQAGMQTWPFDDDAKNQALVNGYPTDPISQIDRVEYKDKFYRTQFAKLDEELKKANVPFELKGGFEALLPMYVWQTTPTTEECWLAQEDFWVGRDMLRIVQDAMAKISRMEPEKIDEQGTANTVAHYRFRNGFWVLDLVIEEDDKGNTYIAPQSWIMNGHVHKRPQLLINPITGEGIEFKLTQEGRPEPFKFRIAGEPLVWGQYLEFKKPIAITGVDFKNKKAAVTAEQVFDKVTSPIKQIVAMKAPYQSHRTSTFALKPRDVKVLPKEDLDAGKGTGGDTGGTDGTGGTGGTGATGGAGAIGGSAGFGGRDKGDAGLGDPLGDGLGAAPGDFTPLNHIDRARFIAATEQCRHMPFALTVVVDQSQVHELLVALANSRMRVQTTQFSMQHAVGFKIGGSAPGTGAGGTPDDGGGTRPPVTIGVGRGKFGGRPGGFPGFPGGIPGFGSGAGGQPQADDEDTNLVELTVYGIAALYERPPVKKPDETTGGVAPVVQPK